MRVVRKNGSNVPGVQCINGYLITISAVEQLFAELKKSHGISFLLTQKLCQDPLENFFAVMRQKGGCSDNPTAQQFASTFKSACINKLLRPTGTGNCEADTNSTLVKFSSRRRSVRAISHSTPMHSKPATGTKRRQVADLTPICSYSAEQKRRKLDDSIRRPVESTLKRKQVVLKAQSINSSSSQKQSTTMYADEKGAFTYTCGAVIRKMYREHTCVVCDEALLGTRELDDESKLYMCNKAYKDNFGGLLVPSLQFSRYLQAADETFEDIFNSHGHESGILRRCMNQFRQMALSPPSVCQLFSVDWCMQYFFRTRVNYTLRFINRGLKADSQCPRKNKKLIKIKCV